MSRKQRLVCLVGACCVAAPLAAQSVPVTDATVANAIERGVVWLKAQRNAAGHWEPDDREPPTGNSFTGYAGDSALACLALLYAGENPRSQFMTESLGWLAQQDLRETYVVGTRAHALALVPGNEYRAVLQRDVDWLVRAMRAPRAEQYPGGYTYHAAAASDRAVDNSNSQFALLGVWMASDAGYDAPDLFWETVGRYWLRHQNDDGGWGYRPADDKSTGSMTAAGLASLYVVLDRYFTRRPRAAPDIFFRIEQALDWFAAHFGPENPAGDDRWKYYYLYGVERIGRASGYKYFRDINWFERGAEYLLSRQQANGVWEGDGPATFAMTPLRNTSFALMFLCHGRAPLLFNKLRYIPADLRATPPPRYTPEQLEALERDERSAWEEATARRGDWNINTRDVAGLTRYTENSLERLLNWQIVDITGPVDDWLEAPVLFMTGSLAWDFTAEEVAKFREYIRRGGLIFACPAERRGDFVAGMRQLAEQLLPERALNPLPADHPLFTGAVRTPIEDRPPLRALSNGNRLVMLLAEQPIAAPWHYFQPRRFDNEFGLGVNIFLYATDKTSRRSRLAGSIIEARPGLTARAVRIARIQHDGLWNPEPYGWERFTRFMRSNARTRLDVAAEGLRLDDPALLEYPVAHLTGTDDFSLSDAERSGLRRFLTRGGTLIADATGGNEAFTAALERELQTILRTDPIRLDEEDPIVTGRGIPQARSLADISYRRAARRRAAGSSAAQLRGFELGPRYAVLYTPLDITTGLLGTRVYENIGYDGDSALEILRNLVLYAQLSTVQKAQLAD